MSPYLLALAGIVQEEVLEEHKHDGGIGDALEPYGHPSSL
jgi:hypothetical protein